MPPDGSTVTERRAITLALASVATAYRARIVHHHHGYRAHDVEGVCKRLRLPLVISAHGHDVTAFAREWPVDFGNTFLIASAVIVPSTFLIPYVEALGTPRERITVIPSGVDLAWFQPSPLPNSDHPRALFAGRFVEKKGIDVLMRAWPKVLSQIPEARLHVLGFGPLEDLARSGGTSVRVELADPTRRAEQLRDAIRGARVVVTPSRTAADGDAETLLLVNLEAQASGRPLVTTRHGGIPEYVAEGETALVVPENDADALAEALVRVLNDDQLAIRLASAGPEWARRFSVDDCVGRVDALYDALLRGAALPR